MRKALDIKFAIFIVIEILAHTRADSDTPLEVQNDDSINCDPPYLGHDEPQELPPNLVRMGPNSKYFLFSGAEMMHIHEVQILCEEYDLQPAEIRHNLELISIKQYLDSFAPPDILVSLGVNDYMKEGEFMEYDETPLRFHSFGEGQPDNRMNMEHCIALAHHPTLDSWIYLDVSCDTGVTPMCMFSTDDDCFYNSPLSLAEVPTGFEHVGSSSRRDYFVGQKQVPQKEARKKCAEQGYTLVDFDTGLNNNQMLYEMVQKWIHRHDIFPRIPFWTGGEVERTYDLVNRKNTPFRFLSSGISLSDLSSWPSLEWDVGEPSDSYSMDDCISAILYKPYVPTENNIFHLASTNCRISHYPLCYKEKIMSEAEAKNMSTDLVGRTNAMTKPTYCKLDRIPLDLSAPALTSDEMKLLTASENFLSFTSDKFRFEWKDDKKWLSDFVDVIFRLGRKISPEDLVPPEYTNLMHNLIILYYNAVENLEEPSEDIKTRIEEETEFLRSCLEDVSSLQFETVGGQPSMLGNVTLGEIKEVVDDYDEELDLIIDSFWFYFLTAVGSCHPQASPSRTKWLLDIHRLFSKYFLSMFSARWMSAIEQKVNYGIIAGDMDVPLAIFSLKICAKAAFEKSKIPDLYFPRPLYIPTTYFEMANEITKNDVSE